MLKHVLRAGLIFFFCLWTVVILLEYYFQNPWHGEAMANFQYYGWLFMVLAAAGGASWFWHRQHPKPAVLRYVNGATLFLLSWLVVVVVSGLYASKVSYVSMGGSGLGRLSMLYVGTLGAVYLLMGISYTLGHLLVQLFPLPLKDLSLQVITLGIGIMALVLLLFLFGSLHLLTPWVLGPLMLVLILLNLPGAREYVRLTLWKPISLSQDLNPIGIFAFGFLLIFVSLNAVQIIRPIPIGADSMALYMRLPALIEDYEGLVQGYSVYNWSLLMALGFVLFDSVEVVLALGYVGGVLSLFAFFALARRWLNVNHAFLALLMFYTLPMVSFHSYQDMKIDLGLLFISLCLLILLVNWIHPIKIPTKEEIEAPLPEEQPKSTSSRAKKGKPKGRFQKRKAKAKTRKPAFSLLPANFWKNIGEKWVQRTPQVLQGQSLIIWLGIFTGFALGTKLTTLFIFFPLLVVLWYVQGNPRIMLATLCLSFFVVLLLGLDRQSDLRHFHLSVTFVQWGLCALGLALLVWEFLKNRELVGKKIRMTIIFSFFFLLPMAPWLVKNFSETHQISNQGLLFGKKALPDINLKTLERNYQQKKP